MLSYLEKKQLEKQDLLLGNLIYKISQRCKDIGVFGENEKKDKVITWIMSMFNGRVFNDANFYSPACFQDKDNDMNTYEAIIYVKLHWNSNKNEIKSSIKNSFEFGLNKFIPILQVDYFLKAENENDKTIYNILSDGISIWKETHKIRED